MNKIEEWIRKIIIACFRLLHLEMKEEMIESLVQFSKFGVVGATNTAISYFLNVTVLMVLRPYSMEWDYVAGNLVAFSLSVLWSFYWNNKYVFKQEDGEKRCIWKTLVRTYIAYGFTGIILTNVLSFIWIHYLHLSKFVAPIINLGISIPLNFWMNKKWAFRKS